MAALALPLGLVALSLVLLSLARCLLLGLRLIRLARRWGLVDAQRLGGTWPAAVAVSPPSDPPLD